MQLPDDEHLDIVTARRDP